MYNIIKGGSLKSVMFETMSMCDSAEPYSILPTIFYINIALPCYMKFSYEVVLVGLMFFLGLAIELFENVE